MAPTALSADVTVTSTLVHESGEYECIFSERYAELKKRIVKKEDEEAVIKAWNEILDELRKATQYFIERGTSVIPQVDFSEIYKLSEEKVAEIKQRGCVLIRNVVDDKEALGWKEQLQQYIKENPGVRGVPKENPQFYEIFWSKAQLRARSHPNVLASSKWLSSFWHSKDATTIPIVSFSTPLSYADRFRIRQPAPEEWTRLAAHVDGGSVARWEDDSYRTCFENILKGSWKSHDPFVVDGRLKARKNPYVQQTGIFMSWQGWLAMSDTGPNEGTLQVFPELILGTSYLILRPFFRMVDPYSPNPLDASNWILDLNNPDFPGIAAKGQGFGPVRLSNKSHPHMRIPEALVSIPRVAPGDMMFWHNDIVHAVEAEHRGKNDSSVMYIGAVPLTPQNIQYILRQRAHFLERTPPPAYVQAGGEGKFVNKGELSDIHDAEGRRALGLEAFPETDDESLGAKEAIRFANELIAGSPSV